MQGTIDVVYATDHKYMLLCCVSIFSLMEQLASRVEVRLHLLIDESFCEEDEKLLAYLGSRFDRLHLIRHSIAEEVFDKRDFRDSIWSKATCYRLVLPELLPNTDLCLYIDSDTLIVGDVLPLWEIDMSEYYLAGVLNDIAAVRHQTVGDHIPGIQNYINAGVLLLNLKRMREDDIQEKLFAGILDYLVVDQDLLNVVCYGAIRLLPSDYNCIPGVYASSPRILHFLMRDYLRPWINRRAEHAALWWKCAENFGLLTDLDQLRLQADWHQRGSLSYLSRRCADYDRIYVCGSGMGAERVHRALRLGKIKGLQKLLPEEEMIPYRPDTLIIIASRKRVLPVVDVYLARDINKEQVIFFTPRPVSFYNLLPPEYEREISGELLMWEFGADCRGIASCSAMLEVNAARYPDKEALVEWRDGRRTECTYRELNRRANRLADWIKKRGIRRGSRMKLPEEKYSATEMTAAILGIMKGGCIVCLSGEADLFADLSSLDDERYSFRMPGIETLPDEPALMVDDEIFCGRELCDRAEQLRRRLGWHAKDRLLAALHQPDRWLIELTAAFSSGNTTIVISDEGNRKCLEKASTEKATIVSMDALAFKETVSELEKKEGNGGEKKEGNGEENFKDLRMLLLGNALSFLGSSAHQDLLQEEIATWKAFMPQVPVDGQGYEGTFFYDQKWYGSN